MAELSVARGTLLSPSPCHRALQSPFCHPGELCPTSALSQGIPPAWVGLQCPNSCSLPIAAGKYPHCARASSTSEVLFWVSSVPKGVSRTVVAMGQRRGERKAGLNEV